MAKKNKSHGQVFTSSDLVKFMIDVSTLSERKKDCPILECSAGEGAFVKRLEKEGFTNISAYEIDEDCKKHRQIKTSFIHEDFLNAEIDKSFAISIGNPPYIRKKNMSPEIIESMETFIERYDGIVNTLSDFSFPFFIRSIELLEEGGELIFVTPSYWLTTVHAQSMREYMSEHGYMRLIVKFNETQLFGRKANFDPLVFSFIKSKKRKKPKIQILEIPKMKYSRSIFTTAARLFLKNQTENLELMKDRTSKRVLKYFRIDQFNDAGNWSIYDPDSNDVGITPSELEARTSGNTLGDIVIIGNGLVTGKDKAFKIDPKMFHELNDDEKRCTKRIVKAKSLKKYTHDDATHYIWLNDENITQEKNLKLNFPNFHRQLYQFTREGWKDRREQDRPLEDRYSYNKKIQWWEWVFLRNKEWLEKEDVKIFCPCKERHDKKEYVRFSLIRGKEVMPLQDVTAIVPLHEIGESAEFITAWLNSDVVYRWLAAKGHARGGVLEFSEAPLMRIPFRRIDFTKKVEQRIHDKITKMVKSNNGEVPHEKIQEDINKLLEIT